MVVDRRPGFGDLLRRYRLAAGLTQEELADRAGLSPRGISYLEGGARAAPRRDTVLLLTEALGLSGDDRAALQAAAREGKSVAEAPAAEPSSGPVHNLSAEPTSFIGRVGEVEEVSGMLLRADTRLLTLTGPGGTGKTRLAAEVARALVEQFPDGTYLVQLAPIVDASLVVPQIARSLGVPEVGTRYLLDTLKEHLREKRLVLVLDNFEQVLGAGPDVMDLVAACPSLKVLATSRSPLRVRGEREYPVPPLPAPRPPLPPLAALSQYDAVKLFIERAVAVRPGFAVTNENAAAVAEICHRLDGLPLAIELAAARVRLFPPQAMLGRLSGRLQLLTGGARDLPARQQTLRGAIAWSYDLLGSGEKRLLARLAVFAGGATLVTIESVCNAEGDIQIIDGIGSLVEQSMLRQEEGVGGEPRFGMLETIREYASERLEQSGEAEEIRRRHAGYFADLAEEAEPQLRGAHQTEWLGTLEQEHDNLRAALDWSLQAKDVGLGMRLAGALWEFWHIRGYIGEGQRRINEVLSADVLPGTPTRAKALFGAGMLILAGRGGNPERARALLEESLSLSQDAGDRSAIALALTGLGNVAMGQGDYERAEVWYEDALAANREAGNDPFTVGILLNNLGYLSIMRGHYERALPFLKESLEWGRQEGNSYLVALVLGNLSDIALYRGDLIEAKVLARQSLSESRTIGDMFGIAQTLMQLAAIAGAEDEPVCAAQLSAASDAICESIGGYLWDADRARYAPYLATARSRLGEAEWFIASGRSRELPLEKVVEYALDLVQLQDTDT